MTCKDCIHYDVCEALENNGISKIYPSECSCFKDKSRFIELPCKVGDKVYFVYRGKMFQHKIKELVIQEWGNFAYSSDCFPFSAFGNYVFLTREEAERALKERESK